jgi:hypothetical protein
MTDITMRVKVWAWRTHQRTPCSLLVKKWDELEYNNDVFHVLANALDGVRQPHKVQCFAVIHEDEPIKTYRESPQWEFEYK